MNLLKGTTGTWDEVKTRLQQDLGTIQQNINRLSADMRNAQSAIQIIEQSLQTSAPVIAADGSVTLSNAVANAVFNVGGSVEPQILTKTFSTTASNAGLAITIPVGVVWELVCLKTQANYGGVTPLLQSSVVITIEDGSGNVCGGFPGPTLVSTTGSNPIAWGAGMPLVNTVFPLIGGLPTNLRLAAGFIVRTGALGNNNTWNAGAMLVKQWPA